MLGSACGAGFECKPKPEMIKLMSFDGFLFGFWAQEQRQVDLKLVLMDFALCVSLLCKDPEERTNTLKLIQKPDFQLCNTISQVKALAAFLKTNSSLSFHGIREC